MLAFEHRHLAMHKQPSGHWSLQHCRLLPAHEIAAWAARLQQLAPRLSGPIYFLWGTDWEDTPIVNARWVLGGWRSWAAF